MASSETYADLHLHSDYSDGAFSPAQLVKKAANAGIDVIALCDHDTYRGIKPAIEAGKTHWIEVIPAVEISTRIDDLEFHMLAYFLDLEDSALTGFLDRTLVQRKERIRAIINNLNNDGIDISYDDIELKHDDTSLGRSHLATALVKRGKARNLGDAFMRYIGDNSPAYEPHASVNAMDVLSMLRQNGAVPVLAHPKEIFPVDKLEKLIDGGLMGIEGFYPTYTERDRKTIRGWANKYNLVMTGGSDFHYEGGHIHLGCTKVKQDCLEQLRSAQQRSKR